MQKKFVKLLKRKTGTKKKLQIIIIINNGKYILENYE